MFLVAAPFKLLAGARIIFDVHDVWPEFFEAKFHRRGLFYWAIRAAERLTYAVADVVLATNQSVREKALTRGGKEPWEVFMVRTAPTIAAAEVPVNPALKKGRPYLVGYVGVMGDADGVDRLIGAARHIVQTRGRRDVHFLLMGTGPEYSSLVQQRDRHGLQEFVDMPGRVSNEFLFSALKSMDLGVACDRPNAYNDHCTMNKTLEYMAFGKPQVMFDVREGRFSAGDAAWYVPGDSAIDLGEAIVQLLDCPDARQRMGTLARERIQNELNWELSVKELLRAYDTALEG
jgi:glycosyltransferase involved in cell wall biosynthesis